MSFDYDKLKNWPFEEITQTYTSRIPFFMH
ncbi:MAG: hypothetical protein CM15mP62_00810 [Rhodospirillaceae bacterium]|nr:MAG: hypothetical protein CM15mP62_00810 [Rhodospirillaceae bacterium]